jgi:hypothetical protein
VAQSASAEADANPVGRQHEGGAAGARDGREGVSAVYIGGGLLLLIVVIILLVLVF